MKISNLIFLSKLAPDIYLVNNNENSNDVNMRIRIENKIDKEILNEIIIQRILYPLINEAFKLLGEGGVPSGRPGDVDIIFVKGKK